MRTKISTTVVIATYNGQKYLSRQIDSILNQTILPEEIIFVDDCSHDQTKKIILEYFSYLVSKGIEVKIVEHKKNIGYIDNFFSGIQIATKDIIFLADQDDIWLPNKIERYVCFFNETPEMLALHGNTNVIDKFENIIVENFQQYKKELESLNLRKYLKKVNYPGMSLAFRNGKFRDMLLEYKEELDLNTHDWFIGVMASLEQGFFTTNEILTLRRYTGENVALKLASKKISTMDSRLAGIELYLSYYELSRKIIYLRNSDDFVKIKKYKTTAEKRIGYLERRSIVRLLINVINIRYYPSFKSYLGDFILLIKTK